MLLDEHAAGAGRAAREARPRDLGRDGRGELRGDDRVRLARGAGDRRRRGGRFGLGGPTVAELGTEARAASRGVSSRAPRRPARGRRRRHPRGRPDPGGGRLRVLGAGARGEPDRRALPGPPDQHEAQAARRRLRPARRDAAELARRFRRGVEEYAAWYREYYDGISTTRRGRSRSTRPGRASFSSRASASSRQGPDAGARRFARDLYHRAIAVEDAADALGGFRSLSEAEAFAIEYWPLERYKLAQAPPRGELAGRDRADHRRRERHRPGGRAALAAARRARRRRRPATSTAPREVADELVAAHGVRRALPSRST